MSKITLAISAPVDTYSGYGARSRDFVKALLALGKYDIKILSQRWGNTRFGYLKDHKEDELASLIVPQLSAQPDVWIQSTVPNEFQKVGKFNIGLTAGMETTLVHGTWIEGCNRMNLVLTSSEHSKKVFQESKFEMIDQKTGLKTPLELNVPIEVLLEGADLSKYFAIKTYNKDSEINQQLDQVKESFCYLFVGHWLQGKLGHDRKNVGFMIKSFLETFKNKSGAPALILKTQRATSSIMDREDIIKKIDEVRKTVKGTLPNIYLIHGELSDVEINELYNHPKVKAMLSFAKGEGFGRPLLEFSLTGKPIIASGWSGQVDFLNPEFTTMIGGELENVHPSAAVKDMILTESMWFKPNEAQVGKALKESFKSYKNLIVPAKKQGHKNRQDFSFEKMTEVLGDILDKKLPDFPKEMVLNLPKLELPSLTKLK